MRKAIKRKINQIVPNFFWEYNDFITRQKLINELFEATNIQFVDHTTDELVVNNLVYLQGYDPIDKKMIDLTISVHIQHIQVE